MGEECRVHTSFFSSLGPQKAVKKELPPLQKYAEILELYNRIGVWALGVQPEYSRQRGKDIPKKMVVWPILGNQI